MTGRSASLEVRNPLLGMEEALEALATLDDSQAEALRVVLRCIEAKAREKERESYKRRKGPLVAYWMATATYCKHIAQAIRHAQARRQRALPLDIAA